MHPAFARRRAPHLPVLGLALLWASACQDPAPDARLAADWIQVTAALTDTVRDQRGAAQVRALASLALFESYAADARSGLRTLAGQLNGLWTVPVAAGPVDGAVVAAEAERLVLAGLLKSPRAAAVADSVANSHAAARRSAGAGRALVDRSRAHGAALARVVLARAAGDAPTTFALRHVAECSYEKGQAGATQAGSAATAVGPGTRADELVEAFAIAAIERADAAVSVGGSGACVSARVQGRIRTR